MTTIDFGALERHLLQLGRERMLARVRALPDRTVEAFLDAYADQADCPAEGFAIVETLVPILGRCEDVVREGDLRIDEPRIVHGDLRVDGQLVVTAHLIVSGSIEATTVHTGYDARVTVLGDVRCRMLFTDGALYIRGHLGASEVLWTTGSGWFLEASTATTRVYVNADDHPDSFGELRAERSFEVRGPTRNELGSVFRPAFFEDDGGIRGWTLLDPVARGVDVCWCPERLSDSASNQVLEALEEHLASWTGTQRELLADLRANWLERLLVMTPDDRLSARRRVRKRIRSPKLTELRDTLLGAFPQDPETP